MDYHSKQVMHDIEHEYDQMFDMFELKTSHPVSHPYEVTYKTLPVNIKHHDVYPPVIVDDHRIDHHQ